MVTAPAVLFAVCLWSPAPLASITQEKRDGGGLALPAPGSQGGNSGYSQELTVAAAPRFWCRTPLGHSSDCPKLLSKHRARKCRYGLSSSKQLLLVVMALLRSGEGRVWND